MQHASRILPNRNDLVSDWESKTKALNPKRSVHCPPLTQNFFAKSRLDDFMGSNHGLTIARLQQLYCDKPAAETQFSEVPL